MSTELMEALTILEQEKDISKETMLDAIENSLMNACKNHFKKANHFFGTSHCALRRRICQLVLHKAHE